MITAIAVLALILASIALGLSIGHSTWISNYQKDESSKQIIRASRFRSEESFRNHIINWLKDIDSKIKAQEDK